jgi:predicted Rossmann fold flavoprotein
MKLAIIGAGASGCFTAANINKYRFDEIIIFEKSSKAMQKIKVSGGGRCNVTHECNNIPELLEHYPRGVKTLKKTFRHFSTNDTIKWFQSRNVTLKTESDGRMFPVTNDSQTIIDCIWNTLIQNNVLVKFNHDIISINKINDQFVLKFRNGFTYTADAVVIACGGLPKLDQYDWIQSLGHAIVPPVPSLFTFNTPKHPITTLMGVSCNVSVKIIGSKLKEEGPLLITHWGFSGPAVLRLSAWGAQLLADKKYNFSISINWLSDKNEYIVKEEILQLRLTHGKQLIWNKNPFGLSKRLWEFLISSIGIPTENNWGSLNATQQNKLIQILTNDIYHINGKTTFKEEFVTSGGVDLTQLQSNSFESMIHKNLYFIGEVTNIDGITGGFNFQNAWTSAWIVAQQLST